MWRFLKYFIQVIFLASLMTPALAAEHGRQHGARWQGDIRRFHEHDIGRWRGGRWYQGRHIGRLGWWWIVGPTWYFYPAPIYPYPDPFLPPADIRPIGPPQYWYYCANPPGYYPYVPQCRVDWQKVHATPQ